MLVKNCNCLGDYIASDGLYYGWGDSGIVPNPIVPSTGFENDPIATITTGVPGFDQAASGSSSLTDLIKAALGTWQLTQQQKAFLETNQMLISQGRQPLAWDQFSPTASVGVSVDSATRNMVMILGIGALAVLALSALRK